MSELDLIDMILRHSLELQRLSSHEEAEAAKLIDELVLELRQLLASQSLDEAGKREVEAIIREADQAIAARYAQIPGLLDTHTLAIHVAERTTDLLKAAIPAATMPTAERLASLAKDILIDGSPASAWWSRQAEDTAFKFAAQVRQGVLNGETQEQIVGRIVGRGDELGIMDLARRNVRTLVHSSVMNAANSARMETYRKNSRHMKGVRVVETLDGNTCFTCINYDGTAWTLDGEPLDQATRDKKLAYRLPLYHFGCRGIPSPIAKGLDEIFGTTGLDARMAPSTRASKDGPTNAVTFDAFLKRQSPEFVDEMLGKRRAELFRAGTITLRDLVSGTGRPLTLDELTAR